MSDDFLNPRLAERLARAARAAQTLSETLWETLQEELGNPRSERVTELSEQLGGLAATVASLARVEGRERAAPVTGVQPESPVAAQSRVSRARYDDPPPGEPASSRETPVTGASPSPAVLVDELAAPAAAEPRTRPTQPGQTHGSGTGTPIRAEGRLPEMKPEIEIRDARGEDGPTAWIDSIGRRLERYRRDGSSFAVLLVEIVDIERLRHAEPTGEASRLTSLLEDVLARGLRPADSLTCESPGRYWLLAPQTDEAGAQVLAERIARAVRASASHRGTPLEVAVGIAVCPDHGRQASELAAHADVALYAARAAGRSSV